MTDEVLFYRRFVADVRRCAAGRAPASVAEIENRVRLALTAPSSQRERSWARLVAAVSELLAGVSDGEIGAAARLRTFVRENADLRRSRDVAITDFRFESSADCIVTDRKGRRYLLFASIPHVLRPVGAPLDEVVPPSTRRLAEWGVYTLCGAAAAAALWFSFVVPV